MNVMDLESKKAYQEIMLWLGTLDLCFPILSCNKEISLIQPSRKQSLNPVKDDLKYLSVTITTEVGSKLKSWFHNVLQDQIPKPLQS